MKKTWIGMTDKKDILSKYEGKEFPPLQKKIPELIKEKSEYNAFEEFKSRKSARFRIIDVNGKSYGCSYTHLIDWVYIPSNLLTITTSSRIFTIKGKNLGHIDQLLTEDKIKTLFVFNEKNNKILIGNKPIIEELEVSELT